MKVKKDSLAYILIMLSCIRIEALTKINAIDMTYDLLKVLGLLVAIILNFRHFNCVMKVVSNKNKFNTFFYCWIIITFLSVVINGEAMAEAIIKYMPMISVFLIVRYAIDKDDFAHFLRVISIYFALMIILSFVTLTIYPEGIIQESRVRNGMLIVETTGIYLLGKANALGPVFIIMSSILLITKAINQDKSKWYILVLMLSFANVLFMGSSTAIMGIIVFCVILLFSKIKEKSCRWRGINYLILFVITIVLTAGVVIYNVQVYFESIFWVLFKKDITFSNRTNTWNMTLKYIGSHFSTLEYLLGTGTPSYSMQIYNGRYAHCHNQILDIFIQSGVLGCFFYLKMFWISLCTLMKKSNEKYSFSMVVVGAATIAVLVMCVVEVYVTPLIILLIMLAYYSDQLCCKGDNVALER